MNEEEKKAIDILKDFAENEDTEYCYDWDGFDHTTILSAIRLLLSLINKHENQLEEKTYLYNKLDTESKHLVEKQYQKIKDLENELKRSNDYIDFYQDLCNKQNTLLKNVCTPYGLDKVHYVFMSYTDSNGEDKRLEIRNDNMSDKCYEDINKEGENNE